MLCRERLKFSKKRSVFYVELEQNLLAGLAEFFSDRTLFSDIFNFLEIKKSICSSNSTCAARLASEHDLESNESRHVLGVVLHAVEPGPTLHVDELTHLQVQHLVCLNADSH